MTGTKRMTSCNLKWAYRLAAALIVIFGGLLRFSHIRWDGGLQFHPDERGIIFTTETIRFEPGLLKPQQSPMNPYRNPDGSARYYAYGTLPLYTNVLINRVIDRIFPTIEPACRGISATYFGAVLNCPGEPDYSHLLYTGRFMSALFDTLLIAAVMVGTWRFYSSWTGLLAGMFQATTVLHIQNAHFGTVDSMLSLTTTLAMLWITSRTQEKRMRGAIITGVLVGMAVGVKINAALLCLFLIASHLNITASGRRSTLTITHRKQLVISVAAAAFTFCLTNPFAILEARLFAVSIVAQLQMVSGAIDWPFTRQYVGTAPLIYPFVQQFKWALGPALTILAYGGLVLTLVRYRQISDMRHVMLAGWVLTVVLQTGIQFVKFQRYVLIGTPAMAMLAAGLCVDYAANLKSMKGRALAAVGTSMAVGITLANALAFSNMYAGDHPWLEASMWMYENLPEGSTLVVEHWDDPLPVNLEPEFVSHRHFESTMIEPFSEPDSVAKISMLADTLANADYVVFSSNRLYGTIPRLADRYPLSGAYYRALFSSRLGYSLVNQFSRCPSLGTLSFCSNTFRSAGLPAPEGFIPPGGLELGNTDEVFSAYDHPLVLVFQNNSRLTAAEISRRIQQQANEDGF